MAQVKQFEKGKKYFMRSACDHDCVWTYKVLARTACTVTLAQVMSNGTTKVDTITCRINKGLSQFCGAESVKPLGSYSMNPILSADNEVIEPEMKLHDEVCAEGIMQDGRTIKVLERYDEIGVNRGCFVIIEDEEIKYGSLSGAMLFFNEHVNKAKIVKMI